MTLFTLRREERVSGEGASSRLLEEVLGELAIPYERAPDESWVFRLAQLRRLAAQNASDTLVVKLPTAAQLPLAARAVQSFCGRVIYWIDGLLWRPLPPAQMLKLVTAESLLNLSRAVINNAAWLVLARRRATEIIVASQTQRAEIARLLPRAKIHVIPNGSPGSGEPRDTALATATRDERAPLRFGYLGHAYLTKGVWDLLEAHRLFRERGGEFPLILALSGLGSAHLRRAAERAGIEVRGEVNPREFLASIDVLVAPLWTAWGTQTFPNILLEAMEIGVPVVTSDLPVCRELFGDDLAVYVPAHNPAALAGTLAGVIRGDTALPSPTVLRARFAAHFSKARIADGWRAILASAA